MHLVASKNATLCLISLIKVLHRVNRSYSGLSDSIVKSFGTVVLLVWFSYLREIDILIAMQKMNAKPARSFLEHKNYKEMMR